MDYSSDMWIAGLDSIPESVAAGNLSMAEARIVLERLGFGPDEIADHIAALKEDFPNVD